MGAKNLQAPTVDVKRLAERLAKSQKVHSSDTAGKSKPQSRPVRVNLSSAPPPTPSDKGGDASKKEPVRKKSTAGRPDSKAPAPSSSPSSRGGRVSDLMDSVRMVESGRVPPALKRFMKMVAIACDSESRELRQELPLPDLASQFTNDCLLVNPLLSPTLPHFYSLYIYIVYLIICHVGRLGWILFAPRD